MKLIMKELTREVHTIVEQFLTHRKEMKAQMAVMDVVYDKFRFAKAAHAQKAPAMEAAYCMMENSPLKLYDCLIPAIEHYDYERGQLCKTCRDMRVRKKHNKPPMSLDQIQKITEYWHERSRYLETKELRQLNESLEAKVEIIQWYQDMFEGGNDPRELLSMYRQLQHDFEMHKIQSDLDLSKAETKYRHEQQERQKLLGQLKD